MSKKASNRLFAILGVILLVAGIWILVDGDFSYTQETHDAKLGPLEFAVSEKEQVEFPPWTGIAGIVVGAGLLFLAGKR